MTQARASGVPERRVSVVVPVFNSARTLVLLTNRLWKILPELAYEYEVIFVDDGSADESWSVIERLADTHGWISGLSLMRNFGQHNALLCGVRAARFEIIVTMDDDLQHPPEEVHHLLRELDRGFDVVYGAPIAMSHSAWRNAMSRLTRWALSVAMGVRGVREVNAFRAFRARLRLAFEEYNSPHLLLDVLLSWGTTRFSSVRVRHDPRAHGQSNYRTRELLAQALLMLTGFSTVPLRFASMVGFFFTLFGVGVLTYTLTFYFLKGSIPGFPFLSSIIAIFSGAQLFALGIIGEYIARIFNRSTERPTYVVAERTPE